MASCHGKTFVLFCAFLFGVANGQRPTDDANLRLDYEILKNRFEDFIEVQFGRLKEEVEQLKNKVKEQDLLLASCASLPPHQRKEQENYSLTGSKVVMSRTCHEARLADPSLPSGVYWIDPDGLGVGDDPIQVNCDMSSGMTLIGHDTEAATNVSHCADSGCYTKPIVYGASIRQILALTQISADCRQSIKYECYVAPLQFNGVEYSWWNDRNGVAQYYWHGNNNSTHTCRCGIDKNCADPSESCNCDAAVPVELIDDGEITAKEMLPVTRLNFGRTIPAASIGVHTLGKLKCTGQKSVVGMPTSCEQLWQIGHVHSGLFLIKGVAQVETVFCDLSKMPTDSGFQTWIGYVDVKSSPVYFYGQRTTSFTTVDAVIPFDRIRLNVGNALNSNGVFVVPKSGKYFFSFSTISNGNIVGRVDLQMKSATSDWFKIAQAYGQTTYGTLTLQSTLQLTKGDQIRLILSEGAIHENIAGILGPLTHFVGWILEEDLF